MLWRHFEGGSGKSLLGLCPNVLSLDPALLFLTSCWYCGKIGLAFLSVQGELSPVHYLPEKAV